jgi:hypothetical protein
VLKCVIKFIFVYSVRNATITFYTVYAPHGISALILYPELRLRLARGYAYQTPSGVSQFLTFSS